MTERWNGITQGDIPHPALSISLFTLANSANKVMKLARDSAVNIFSSSAVQNEAHQRS